MKQISVFASVLAMSRLFKGKSIPICSMYGIFTYIWVISRANVGKYSIHGAYGIGEMTIKWAFKWWNKTSNSMGKVLIKQGRKAIKTSDLNRTFMNNWYVHPYLAKIQATKMGLTLRKIWTCRIVLKQQNWWRWYTCCRCSLSNVHFTSPFAGHCWFDGLDQ